MKFEGNRQENRRIISLPSIRDLHEKILCQGAQTFFIFTHGVDYGLYERLWTTVLMQRRSDLN